MNVHRSTVLFLALGFLANAMHAQPAVERTADGVVVPLGDSFLALEVRGPNAIRVACARDRAFFTRDSLIVPPRTAPLPAWRASASREAVTLTTDALSARLDLATGAVSFLDAAGQVILAERAGGRTFTPVEIQGEQTAHARQVWEPRADEALYGLGQHQFGLMNIRGYDLDLYQRNTVVSVPFLVSSAGYGILWENTSRTRFGDVRDPELVPAEQLLDAEGRPGGLSASYFADAEFGKLAAKRTDATIDIALGANLPDRNQRIHPDLPPTGPFSVRWEGFIEPRESGEFTLLPFYCAGLKLWVDGELVADHWRQGWLAWFDLAKVRLEAGRRHAIRLDWSFDQDEPKMRLLWKTPTHETGTSLWAEVADGTDYTFIHGPELDRVVAGYREVTGRAPMMPRWAFGLWQSRERYQTQQQSLDVLARFRALGAPVDNIVQDWFYWRAPEWGSHEFDEARFPDPAGWIRAIHEQHARLMISVWPKFNEGTRNFDEMFKRGFLFQPNLDEKISDWVGFRYTFYDAYNPGARKLFWAQMNRELFSKGVDAWWLDASEPEMRSSPLLEEIRHTMPRTALGTGSRVLCAYPLMNAQGVYRGQREAAPDQRVFILTRSGFAGMQRYAAAVWSGDITSTWTAFRRQIPAGLSFTLSGLPYWTTDSGGFAVPNKWTRRDEKSATPDEPIMSAGEAEEWAELNTRWLQYATFCPLMRVHGQFPFREMWQFGGESSPAYAAQLKMDRLRYRLLPYVYSLAGGVTHENATMLRALAMDFRTDATAREIGDQFMAGPAFLVTPVTEFRARSRSVYLPATPGGWFDFWTGAALEGGRRIDAAAPFDTIPVQVRAGSIVPVGPELQYTAEKPADPITLYVYAGADGAFTLYEDDGVSYGYERGESARIPMRWDDAARTLTLGARDGTFPGMLAERTFEVVLVTREKPAGFSFSPKAGRSVKYHGEAVSVKLE